MHHKIHKPFTRELTLYIDMKIVYSMSKGEGVISAQSAHFLVDQGLLPHIYMYY